MHRLLGTQSLDDEIPGVRGDAGLDAPFEEVDRRGLSLATRGSATVLAQTVAGDGEQPVPNVVPVADKVSKPAGDRQPHLRRHVVGGRWLSSAEVTEKRRLEGAEQLRERPLLTPPGRRDDRVGIGAGEVSRRRERTRARATEDARSMVDGRREMRALSRCAWPR